MSTSQKPASTSAHGQARVPNKTGFLVPAPINRSPAAALRSPHALAASKRTVEHSLKVSTKRANVHKPLRSPSAAQTAFNPRPLAPFVPGPLPIDETKAKELFELSQGHHGKTQDKFLAENLIELLPPSENHARGKYRIHEAVVSNFCTAQQGMRRLPSLSPDFPRRYQKLDLRFNSVEKTPVVLLDGRSAPGSEYVATSAHGYAYMTAPVIDALQKYGQFHLCTFVKKDVVGQNGEERTQNIYRYCGLYTVHQTPYLLSVNGWQHLSEDAKRAAATINYLAPLKRPISTATEEAIQPFRDQFSTGEARLRLVLFQCITFPHDYANVLMAMESQYSQPVSRPATKRNIPPRAVIESWGTQGETSSKARPGPKRF